MASGGAGVYQKEFKEFLGVDQYGLLAFAPLLAVLFYSNTGKSLYRARKWKDSLEITGCWKGGRGIDLPMILLQAKKSGAGSLAL